MCEYICDNNRYGSFFFFLQCGAKEVCRSRRIFFAVFYCDRDVHNDHDDMTFDKWSMVLRSSVFFFVSFFCISFVPNENLLPSVKDEDVEIFIWLLVKYYDVFSQNDFQWWILMNQLIFFVRVFLILMIEFSDYWFFLILYFFLWLWIMEIERLRIEVIKKKNWTFRKMKEKFFIGKFSVW